MDWFAALITNPYLIVGVGSWALAQVVKSIIDTAINRKWWDFMADIMETNPDNSPVSIDLKPLFHLD